MRFIFILIFLFGGVASSAVLVQENRQYPEFNVRNKVVRTVTASKNFYFKTILLSAFNTNAARAELELRDSATVMHRFQVTSGAVQNIFIDFDEPLRFDETITLNLVTGNSGAVGASITVIGYEY